MSPRRLVYAIAAAGLDAATIELCGLGLAHFAAALSVLAIATTIVALAPWENGR